MRSQLEMALEYSKRSREAAEDFRKEARARIEGPNPTVPTAEECSARARLESAVRLEQSCWMDAGVALGMNDAAIQALKVWAGIP